ncbi:radical SAM protein [Candidatus Pacearchaeota archaeon]|nr:radical SAM protein [Candidatus Pacearchaeota archaeon]
MGKVKNLLRGYHYPIEVYSENQRKGGFTQLSLDLSSKCNYRCDWCFNSDILGKDSEDLLSLKEKKCLLEQSIKLGAKTLVIPGTGEPTLDKDFYPLIEYAHELGLTTVVYSNLTGNLDKNLIKKLFENDVSVGVKFDSNCSEYFEKRYHANKKDFHKFFENLQYLSEIYSQSYNPDREVHRVAFNSVLTHENKESLSDLGSWGKGFWAPLFIRPVKPVTWASKNPELWKRLGNKTGGDFPDQELVELAEKHNTLFSPSSTLENHCAIYSFGLTVKNNGDIQICPDHHESRGYFGNVRDVDLKEVMKKLNSQRKIQPGYCVMLPDVKH